MQYSNYQTNNFVYSEYTAFAKKKKEVGFWNALSYQLGKTATNVAAIGVSGEIGNGIGGMFPSGGISMEFTMPQFATANGAMMTAVQVSVSKSNILLAANMMGGGLAAQGVMYSTSQSNNDFSNKNTGKSSNNTSGGSSKTTSQGSPGDKSNPNGKFENAPYHGKTNNSVKNKAPIDGQAALNNSLKIGEDTTRRVGISENEFVVLDETSEGLYHGHVRTWDELTPKMQSILRKEELVTKKGKIK